MVDAMIWKACPDWPDYEVSDCGDVRRGSHVPNQAGRRLRGFVDADGYIRYAMRKSDGTKSRCGAHQLVAAAFLGPAPSTAHQVAHRNGSRILNTWQNLRWSTCAENQSDRASHGTSVAGVNNPKARLTEDDVRFIRRRYREIKMERGRVAELDDRFGICRSQVIRIARGQSWGHVA